MARKPVKKAVVLTYDRERHQAPHVTAKGEGKIAEKILEIAARYGIPVTEDPDLLEVLAKLDINQEIPPEIYVAVAELLAFVYSSNQKKSPR